MAQYVRKHSHIAALPLITHISYLVPLYTLYKKATIHQVTTMLAP